MSKFLEKYNKEAVPEMMKRFRYKSVMAVPRILKVVINTGFGRQVVGKTGDEQKKFQEFVQRELDLISGQKSVLRGAKKAISSFKTREGMGIGASCSLRGKKMHDFIERLTAIALPRSRDFQGIDQKSFDNKGNVTIGIKEHISFPEILPEKAKNIFGLEVTVVANAKNKEEGINLLKLMGFPIKS